MQEKIANNLKEPILEYIKNTLTIANKPVDFNNSDFSMNVDQNFTKNLLKEKEENLLQKKNPQKKTLKENFIFYINKVRGEEPRTDKENLFYIFLGHLLFSLGHLVVKIISKTYPDTNGLNISIYRYLVTAILSHFLMKLLGVEVLSFNQINRKVLFFVRIFSNFILMISSANIIFYLRFGTCMAFLRSAPFFTSILSVFILKEKCLPRYFVGCFLGVIAILLFSYGDLRSDVIDFKEKEKSSMILIGLSWSILAIFCNCVGVTLTKILVGEIDLMILIHALGIGGFVLSIILHIIMQMPLIFDIGFLLLCFVSGIFNFLTLLFMISNFKNSGLILTNTFSYLSIVLGFAYGIIFFGEDVTSNDIFAFLLLFSYSIYNVKYPPKRK